MLLTAHHIGTCTLWAVTRSAVCLVSDIALIGPRIRRVSVEAPVRRASRLIPAAIPSNRLDRAKCDDEQISPLGNTH
jgi:hypothetical protein